MTTAGWTSILLAGERPGDDGFARSQGVSAKALIPVAGEPMLGRVARTLLDCPSVRDVVILAQQPEQLLTGPLEWMRAEARIRTARGGAGISGSISGVAGSEAAPFPLLVTTADHALLTVQMVETFLAGAGEADVAFALVEQSTVEAAFPETRRTWLRFSDGAYTGANLFALRTGAAHKALQIWAGIEQDRKKARRILSFFGPWLALRALTRTISLDSAARMVGRKAGLKLRPVRLPFAEAAIDVDKPADLELVERILTG
jgi:GTP:adenosylcobinamide-phosphate guanylyltransferase